MRLWLAPAGLHIEPARPEDAGALAALHAQGFFRAWPISDFQAYLADPATTPAYVACDARRTVAGFAIVRLLGDEAEILTVAVARKWRGKGLGQAVLAAVIEDLRMSPVKTLFLEVSAENVPALRLYRGFGFVEIGTRKGYYPRADGGAATALVMRADLG